ncbi:hypothetical protein RB195_007169 [Necator americanus]|uniref:Vesicle-fusing ATPase n=1 Tax=Necator americanus TaxID=51031 RepID=A0ABR1BW00_NECAM
MKMVKVGPYLLICKRPIWVNHRLLVLATSSNRSFLRELELINAFGHVIDVPVLSTPTHILHVLQESEVFTNNELEKLAHDLQNLLHQQSYGIGIKRLLGLIDFCRKCEEGYRAQMLYNKIEAIAIGVE